MHIFKKSIFLILLFCIILISLKPVDSENNQTVQGKINLTPQEKQWLSNHKVILTAGPANFPPFHFYENGKPSGICVDYARLIEKALGIEIRYQAELPWKQVLALAKEKKIDLITCAAVTEERKTYLDFSDPYVSFPLVIVSRKDANFIGGIEDLHGKTVATVRKTLTMEWLQNDHIDFKPYFAGSPEKALEAVAYGKADAHIENLAAATYLIQKNGLINLKIAAPAPYTNYTLNMAANKDNALLISAVNKALTSILMQDQTRIRNRWLSMRFEHGIQLIDIIKWAAPVLIFILIVLGLVLDRNRKLKKATLEHLKTAEKLKASEKKYRHLFSNAPAGMYEIDFINGRFLSVNEVMCKYSGYTEEEFLSMDPVKILTKESLEKYIQRLLDFPAGTSPRSDTVEYTIRNKNGSTLIVNLNADYYFKDGKLSTAHVVAHDITQIKAAEEEKIQAQRIAGEHEKLALVGKIAGKMAHDFNNILGIIMGTAELSIYDCEDPKIRQSLELIFEQTRRGKNLTRNLVAFAKDQEPKQTFFHIREKIDLVLSLLRKDLENIQVIRDDAPDIPMLLADPGMIEHAMVNLIQNSIHALQKTSSPEIIIRTFFSKERICLEITDNGCGIPEAYAGRIYEPAFTLKGSGDVVNAYPPDVKGTGYGMSNIKKYIEQHKGEISFRSEQNAGTCFLITLPAVRKKLTDEDITHIRNIKMVSGKKILLVEDEPDIYEVQRHILSQPPCRHEVDVATDGRTAVELFSRGGYDFVSLDYVLPGKINGMDVYKEIRMQDEKIPILFISGNFSFLESVKTLKQKDPWIDHLSKPCMNKDYVHSINVLLNRMETQTV